MELIKERIGKKAKGHFEIRLILFGREYHLVLAGVRAPEGVRISHPYLGPWGEISPTVHGKERMNQKEFRQAWAQRSHESPLGFTF